ncbi:MAG: hypothetical protein MJE68_08815, partial [Proteobacteria bacterium]|nr:hypothetical protein [Pseudomonadota bacterium]
GGGGGGGRVYRQLRKNPPKQLTQIKKKPSSLYCDEGGEIGNYGGLVCWVLAWLGLAAGFWLCDGHFPANHFLSRP